MTVLLSLVGLSIVALAVGPVLIGLGRGVGQRTEPVVDGFTLGVVVALVAAAIIPHLFSELGLPALVLLAAGYLVFSLAEAGGERLAHGTSALIVPALVIHSLLDGAALALAVRSDGRPSVGPSLAIALVVHRFAEGLAAGTILIPRFGKGRTAACVALMAAATLCGAGFGDEIVRRLGDRTLHGVVAFGMGVILHLIGHGRRRVVRNARATVAFFVGVAVALAVPAALGG